MKKLILVLLNICAISVSQASDECTLNLLWGHGGGAKVRKAIKERAIRGENIYQGCGVRNQGDNKYQMNQEGFNGDWMSTLRHNYNGGLVPIMSKEMNKAYYKNNNFGREDYDLMTDFRKSFPDVEKRKVEELAEMLGVHRGYLNDGLLSVGFMRLTHYHWAALVKRADELISQKTCTDVKINFICHSDSEDERGGTLDDKIYHRRFSKSKFEHLENIDKSLIIDAEGSPAIYEEKECVKFDDGTQLKSVPLQCNEGHTLTKEIIEKYRAGACGDFLPWVSTKYKEDTKLLDRIEIFRKENLNDGYSPYGSYPIHPNALNQ